MVRDITTSDGLVKVHFRLEQDEDGYPPHEWESLWARELGADLYELDNIPFFAQLVGLGDHVRATHRDGVLVFDEVVATGGHSTVRVIAFNEEAVPDLREQLEELGCGSEMSHVPTLFAMDVPPDVDYAGVRRFLDDLAGQGQLEYEESALQH